MARHALLCAFALIAAVGLAQNLPLPPLPYAYDALEPYLSERAMKLHHGKHHQAYTDKLNGALAALRADPATKALAKLGVDALLKDLSVLPEPVRTTVRNHGGGYVNHELVFSSMQPGGGGQPEVGSPLGRALAGEFGQYEAFRAAFSETALGVFGSGYTWLWADEAGKLHISATANQDSPVLINPQAVPILVLDLWEHQYYPDFENRRAEFVSRWFDHLVAWPVAEQRYAAALEKQKQQKAEL